MLTEFREICVQNNVIQKEKSHTDLTDFTDLFVASNGSHYASQENSEGVKIREICEIRVQN